jgi:hypothetical protein
MKLRRCAQCNRPFRVRQYRAVYCSKACLHRRCLERMRVRHCTGSPLPVEVKRACIVCGKTYFLPNKMSRTICCSDPCRKKRKRKMASMRMRRFRSGIDRRNNPSWEK